MNERAPRHPEIRTMVAFIEGRLPPGELAAVSGHLRDCRDCRTVVTETARFEREETRAASPSRRTSWWLPLAAFLATVAITIPLVRWSMSRRISPIEQLIAAAPNEHRTVGARLSGFPWARLQAPSRGGTASPDPADMKLVGDHYEGPVTGTTPCGRGLAPVDGSVTLSPVKGDTDKFTGVLQVTIEPTDSCAAGRSGTLDLVGTRSTK